MQAATGGPILSLGDALQSLSDPQAREIGALFSFLDTDNDGRLSPRTAAHLCEMLGFTTEHEGMPPLVSLPDVLGWCNAFQTTASKSEELKLTQRFTLLKGGCGGESVHRASVDALMRFLNDEQHACRPEAVQTLIEEMGTEGAFTRATLRKFTAKPKGGGASPSRTSTRV